jgi:hypothetical protein
MMAQVNQMLIFGFHYIQAPITVLMIFGGRIRVRSGSPSFGQEIAPQIS